MQKDLAPNSSAQQRQSLELSPRPTQTLEPVSRFCYTVPCSETLDVNSLFAEPWSVHGSEQKRALGDLNSLLDRILLI